MELVVDMLGTFDVFTGLGASQGVLDLNLGTVWNNWNDTWAGDFVQDVNRRTNTSEGSR